MFNKDITVITGPLMSGKTILATNFTAKSDKKILFITSDPNINIIKKRIFSLKSIVPLVNLSKESDIDIPKNIKVKNGITDLMEIEFEIMGEDYDYVIIDNINSIKSEQKAYLPKIITTIAFCNKLIREYKCKVVLTLNTLFTQEFKHEEISDLFSNIEFISLKHKTSELELNSSITGLKKMWLSRSTLRVEEKRVSNLEINT